tara:strand:- start:567 stop:1412 length:846 start_codon:yes stop_codon:yes gene_type:complete
MNFLKPGLYIVSTPIGNLEDITLRSLEILKSSDIILCEDTRRSLKLLNHYNIKKKLVPYHKFNEKKELNKIIKYLNEGKILSLISDAGTPLLSDPGHLLVKECLNSKISVYPIPGASSISASMSVSGFEDKFIFYGFLPKKEKELKKILLELKDLNFSIIFFVPGIKINFYLKNFKSYFYGRNLFIARELTKIHETFYRESVDKIKLFSAPLKGEVTIVISKKYNKSESESDSETIKKQAMKYLKKYSLKDVVDLISKKEKVSKNKVYQVCLGIKKNEENS